MIAARRNPGSRAGHLPVQRVKPRPLTHNLVANWQHPDTQTTTRPCPLCGQCMAHVKRLVAPESEHRPVTQADRFLLHLHQSLLRIRADYVMDVTSDLLGGLDRARGLAAIG